MPVNNLIQHTCNMVILSIIPLFYLLLFVCFTILKCLDKSALVWYNNQAVGDNLKHLGVAQLVARYLGVVEAARSSRVTQTSSEVHNEPPNFLYFTGFFGLLGVCTVSKTSAIFLPKIGSKSGTTTCWTTFVTKKLYSIRVFDTSRFLFYAK